ncbi:biotin/lipoyl-containing protein [Aliarcobacter cryaerophilus]|jgi:pyruvate carboxylase subunit B|uniref:biotin/lipoyl-containing protein n=1 Tax=Aliarcobacter cryaerophilus TaxID=28198 RepID=UPI00083734DE|nr:biotin/lipoyl-containing protein [Aliarcobacter cryaerophilus]NCB10576.1 biotin attachment protein [Erysipelotrichia bacterium]OQA76394.1 MAG: 2-oxoglutarate carboxylase large subunit [Candidatus Dependentiae bacterium ADurb.Bin246]MCT7444294.1 biotin attachment protein [Aliarcobacter cryaerophilus]MCT7463477.1 biotin attachment protein [Aliarcobacter cryaerophilus]MCT7468034.1 biotin attachment protein [Aliarcobacter cryaerophilus]
MSKKYIDIMDTTFRDGFQSVFGGRVLMNDFFPAVEAAKDAGITHFEFGGGARFQSLFFYLNENAFDMMDKFRAIVGPDANLQTLARGINTVMLDTGSRELIDLHAKMFAKHGTTTIRNFDALNDVQNLEYSAQCIKNHGLKHEAVVTLMDLPPNCTGAHDVPFYEKTLRNILDSGLPFDSICFKDASGTSSPNKVFETIKMARKLLGDSTHIRLHTHETAGVSVACYLAALEAGADGIDLAASPVSGGTSQPDILTMLHATKGMNYDLGGLEIDKILKYEEVLADCLKDYFLPPEATQVSPLIPFSPMPGGALTANTQMMRDNGTLNKFPEVIKAMQEVVVKGGFGTSVTPVSQFYWQQAYANVMFGPWKQIAPGYGRMVLGYFGKTPVEADPEIIKLASEKLKLEPTKRNPLDIADEDPKKKIDVWRQRLEIEGIEATEENIFIAAACDEKGIAFLKGNAPLNVRKNEKKDESKKIGENKMSNGNYTVVVDGQRFNVSVFEGDVQNIQVAQPVQQVVQQAPVQAAPVAASKPVYNGTEAIAPVNGNVWKILVKEGDRVEKDQQIMILEAMKMEIDVVAPVSGTISKILTEPSKAVEEGQTLAVIS